MKLIKKYNKKTTYRLSRIAQEIKKEISIILKKDIKDPRINFHVTISMVQISKDLSSAKIFISYLDSYNNSFNHFNNILNVKNILLILKNAAGYIKKRLSKNINLRTVPILNFVHDDSLNQGIKISDLLKNL